MPNLKEKVAKGAVWTLAEKISCQAVSFVVGIILARLLTPTDYGTVALTGIFFAVAGVLVDCGFGGALIQKKDADDLDFNSVFYLNFALSTLAYCVFFFAAPWIADFYHTPVLKNIVRVSALCFFFNAVNAIQGAELTKKRWAAAEKLVTGYDAETFAPSDCITREQLAVILCRYAERKGIDVGAVTGEIEPSAFYDAADIADYAAEAMRFCVAAGIIGGSNGRLMPKKTATRAQTAAMLCRFLALIDA